MSRADSWDPTQYDRYRAEREQPFWDLAGLLAAGDGPRVVDLGCGDGRLTAALGGALDARSVLGIDSSPSMLEGAATHTSNRVAFELGDLGAFERPAAYDVVFANASLHWVPDHAGVLTRWRDSLRPGGQLAVQVPANADHPSHQIAAEVAAELLEDPPPDVVAVNVLAPEAYACLLDDLGFVEQSVRLQVYPHHLPSTSDVVEWVKGTTLTRFKEPLGADGWDRFVDRYRERLVERLGDRSPFFYPFKRILIWGRLATSG